MKNKKHVLNPIEIVLDLTKKQLILELFKMNVSQIEISRKLKMDNHTINEFLKGIKKN